MTKSQERRGGVRRLWLLTLAAVLVWSVWVVWQVTVSAQQLRAGQRQASTTRQLLSPQTLRTGEVSRSLDAAAANFDDSSTRLRHPLLAPARMLPLVGRQLRAMTALSRAAGGAAGAGERAADDVRILLESPHATGAQRLELLAGLDRVVDDLERELADVDLGPSDDLVPPLARARNSFASHLGESRAAAQDAAAAIGAVDGLLRGPSRYLVLAANNAEMRAGTGMFLSVGVLHAEGGELELSDLQRASAVALPGEGVPVDGDLAARWGWTNLNREWRNLGMSPRFDANAELASRMWTARTGDVVDGVVALDVLALASLLAATGPVDLDGHHLDAESAVPFLLNEQYDGLDGDADQAERRERLGELATLVISRVQAGTFDVDQLASGLMASIERRHIMAWSPDRRVQEGWRAAGATGELTEQSLMVSVLNRAGNKLDWFLRIENDATVTREEEEEAGRILRLRVRLTNRVSDDEPRYVRGPDRRVDLPAGTYLGLVAVNTPRGSSLVDVEGGTVSVQGADGPTEVTAVEVHVAPRASHEVIFRFRLDPKTTTVRVEPSARESPARWAIAGRRFRDHRPHAVDLAAATHRGEPR